MEDEDIDNRKDSIDHIPIIEKIFKRYKNLKKDYENLKLAITGSLFQQL